MPCTVIPPSVIIQLCSAVGRPKRRISAASSLLKQSRTEANANGFFRRQSTHRQMSAERNCAATVASAAPATPIRSPRMNHKSSTMLHRLDAAMAASGVRESPVLRSTALAALYSALPSSSPAVMRR